MESLPLHLLRLAGRVGRHWRGGRRAEQCGLEEETAHVQSMTKGYVVVVSVQRGVAILTKLSVASRQHMLRDHHSIAPR